MPDRIMRVGCNLVSMTPLLTNSNYPIQRAHPMKRDSKSRRHLEPAPIVGQRLRNSTGLETRRGAVKASSLTVAYEYLMSFPGSGATEDTPEPLEECSQLLHLVRRGRVQSFFFSSAQLMSPEALCSVATSHKLDQALCVHRHVAIATVHGTPSDDCRHVDRIGAKCTCSIEKIRCSTHRTLFSLDNLV